MRQRVVYTVKYEYSAVLYEYIHVYCFTVRIRVSKKDSSQFHYSTLFLEYLITNPSQFSKLYRETEDFLEKSSIISSSGSANTAENPAKSTFVFNICKCTETVDYSVQ